MKHKKSIMAIGLILLLAWPAFADGKGKLGRRYDKVSIQGTVPVSQYVTKGHHKFCPMNSIIKSSNESYGTTTFLPKGKLGK